MTDQTKTSRSSIETIHHELSRLEKLARDSELSAVAEGIAAARREAERLKADILSEKRSQSMS